MKGNWLLLSIFGVLALAALYFLQFNDQNTSLQGGDWDFAVKDTAGISRIFLAEASGKTALLERHSTGWTVNGNKTVRKDAIANLLETIHNVEILTRLPRPAVPNVIKDIATNKIKVEIYSGQTKLKCYYLGGVNQDETGVNMIMEDSNEPYICSLPQWTGNIRIRYITDETTWRDRTVFNEEVENILSVSVDYPLQKSKSFKMTRSDANYQVVPFYELTLPFHRPVNKGLTEAFLTGFKKQVAEGFENDNPQRDSIQRTTPFAIISLKTINGHEKTIKLFPIIPTGLDGNVRVAPQGGLNFERYYAQTNDGDFMMVQNLNFQRILWGYDVFFQ